MARGIRWSSEELHTLKTHYSTSTIEQMLILLPERSKDAIQWKASQLDILIRNGKQIRAVYKIIVNITEAQHVYLKSKRNHSRIIREALDLYIKENENNGL